MILISDNDILIKLVGCHLFNETLLMLNATTNDIIISTTAKYAIKKQAKKQISDENIRAQLIELIDSFQTTPEQDIAQLSHLSKFKDLDGGESQLILAAINTPNSLFLTGDKRCLNAIIQNSHDAQIANIAKQLTQRVYCLEHLLLQLINHLGFDVVKTKILNKCVKDGMLDIVFRIDKSEQETKEGLCSFGEITKFTNLLADTPKHTMLIGEIAVS